MRKWPTILEVHRTELGNIYLERPAGLFEGIVYYIQKAWYWYTGLIVEVDDRWDSEENNGN